MREDAKLKLVLLPLDERPCNAIYPLKLFGKEELDLRVADVLGKKKEPALFSDVARFLEDACADADGLILSLDMLLYGGLVPSRIHQLKQDELLERLSFIKTLKKKYPDLVIYALQCIMRCPSYSSSDEEPDYYADYGSQIHELGETIHKENLGVETDRSSMSLTKDIDESVLADYTKRRAINLQMNRKALELVEDETISFLVIPQDDSAPFSYSAMEQQEVRSAINARRLNAQVLMYPGADEVGLSLISRMLLAENKKKPKVYVKYAADQAKSVVPPYESNSLETTIRYHILAAGCRRVDDYQQADIILAITAPAGEIVESNYQPSIKPGYIAERNLPELLDFLSDMAAEAKVVAVCDNAYCNGGELELIGMLDRSGLLSELASYAGWNTSANSLGTTIAAAVDAYLFGQTVNHRAFIAERYIEDSGYDSLVRSEVTHMLAAWDLDYFNLKDQSLMVAETVRGQLQSFVSDFMPSMADRIVVEEVKFPWNRMFEIDISIKFE